MAGFVERFGERLLSSAGEVKTADALSGKKAVAIYFSGHWCPPCRGFTPKLAEWYNSNLKAKGLEVVFVSSDRDEAGFKDYFGEMPWLALPYEERDKKEEMSKMFKVQGIPAVVILGPDGSLISKDGREAISGDPTGEEIPWKPKSFEEIFSEAKLLGSGGTTCLGSSLKGKVFGLYFSAHWCPPCRGFTPQLAGWYNTDLKSKGFEVVFVSSDREEKAFNEYFAEQPWLALDYGDRKRKEQLSNLFGVNGIPSFVIIDKDGSVITKDGRAALSGDPTGVEFPWHPKPVSNLKAGPGSVNEVATVIAFCESSDAAAQAAVEAAMMPLAKKLKAEAKTKNEEEPEFHFLMVTESTGLATKIRGMMSLPSLPPSKHEHPLEKREPAPGWACDGCGQPTAGKDRFRCTQGCDHDFCADCNAKAGTSVSMPPKLMLLDIPDKGGFYEGPEGDVTEAVVNQFVTDYRAKEVKRKQLS